MELSRLGPVFIEMLFLLPILSPLLRFERRIADGG